jgi:hypothetical protein
MNLQSLVVVVLRLMAFDFFLRAAVQLAPQLVRFAGVSHDGLDSDSRSMFAVAWGLVFLLVVSAALIWIFALPIARLVTRGVPRDISFGSLSLSDCYSITFIGIGVFYIASHLPQVLNWAHYFLKSAASGRGDSEQGFSGYDVSQALIPFIIGVVLFVNGRRWAVALARRQTESSSPAVPLSESHESDT